MTRLYFLVAGLMILLIALLLQQGFFTSAPMEGTEPMLFLDVSRMAWDRHLKTWLENKK